MKSTLRKLIPSIIMVLIAATMAGTSTFAWFSMNNRVTVTGMQVTTKVSSNLLIAEDEITSTTKKADNLFTNVITQSVKGLLEPVSTPDALNFFYTTDAKANGEKDHSVSSSAYVAYTDTAAVGSDASLYEDKFSQDYGVTKSDATVEYDYKAVPYVDYVFQLKASNTAEGEQYINVTKLNLKYYGNNDTSKAFRVAFFVEDITSGTASAAPAGSSGTFAVDTATNFDTATASNAVVATTTTYEEADYSGLPTLATVAASTTKYYKVVVRMWIEGQDTTCYSENFVALTDKWELGIELKLQDTTVGRKTVITKVNSSGELVD